jgi:hypothetical protein
MPVAIRIRVNAKQVNFLIPVKRFSSRETLMQVHTKADLIPYLGIFNTAVCLASR